MNANMIQSLISLNASKITVTQNMVNTHVEFAREHRFDGNESLMIDSFKKANKLRSKLPKLHEMQNKLYAELKAIYRHNRILSKSRKLALLGGVMGVSNIMTSFQHEAELDRLIGIELRKAA